MSPPAEPGKTGRRSLVTAGGLLVGLFVLVVLAAWQGAEVVVQALSQAGWRLLWLPVFFTLGPLIMATLSWRALFPKDRSPPWSALLHAGWVGTGVNWLLPVAQMGGEVVRVRLLVNRGGPGAAAGATVVVDKTLVAVSQVVTALAGAALLLARHPEPVLIWGVLAGTAALGFLVVLFHRVQQRGLFRIVTGMARRFDLAGEGMGRRARDADAVVREVYGDRGRVGRALAWRLLARVVLVGEVWLALSFLGVPVTLVDAVILDFLGQAVRAAAFLVPAGLGVQEGGFALLAAAVGIGPGLGVALSLARRVREVVLGVPALAVWQAEEGWKFVTPLRMRDAPADPGPGTTPPHPSGTPREGETPSPARSGPSDS